MKKVLGAACAGLLVLPLCAAAVPAQAAVRVRGSIESVHPKMVVVKAYSGHKVDLMLVPGTRFASVVPSSLSDIKDGDFVGIGATGKRGAPVALEVVIFPKSMRGTGEGHYGWSVPATVAWSDTHHNLSAPTGAPPVHGTMTNGTVTKAPTANNGPPVQGTMTNGTVAASFGAGKGKELTISYDGSKNIKISVPPGAPVVRFVLAKRSVMLPGAKTFAVATKPKGSSQLTARFVAVGKNGLIPPM